MLVDFFLVWRFVYEINVIFRRFVYGGILSKDN